MYVRVDIDLAYSVDNDFIPMKRRVELALEYLLHEPSSSGSGFGMRDEQWNNYFLTDEEDDEFDRADEERYKIWVQKMINDLGTKIKTMIEKEGAKVEYVEISELIETPRFSYKSPEWIEQNEKLDKSIKELEKRNLN